MLRRQDTLSPADKNVIEEFIQAKFGGVALEAFYLNDKLEGEVKIFDSGGTVRVQDTYLNDEFCYGKFTQYYLNFS